MKLFYKAGACSLSPHIVLREAGLDFTAEKVDLAQKKTESGADYLAINPKGQVPALLLDDGSLLTEGVAIALPRDRMAELHRHRTAQRVQPAVQPENARGIPNHRARQAGAAVQLSGFGAGEAALPVGKPFQRSRRLPVHRVALGVRPAVRRAQARPSGGLVRSRCGAPGGRCGAERRRIEVKFQPRRLSPGLDALTALPL